MGTTFRNFATAEVVLATMVPAWVLRNRRAVRIGHGTERWFRGPARRTPAPGLAAGGQPDRRAVHPHLSPRRHPPICLPDHPERTP